MTSITPDYCPVCSSIDISAGYCQHCGSESVSVVLQQKPPDSMVAIKHPGGTMLMSADRFHKLSDSKFKKLIGGKSHEKRNPVCRRQQAAN